jgi:protein SCO1
VEASARANKLRFRSPIVAATVIVSFVILFLIVDFVPPRSSLPRYGKVPQFSFVDARGKTFDTGEVLREPQIIGFFFTSCPTTCPLVSMRFKEILKATSLTVLAVSIDEKNDTDDALKEYEKKYSVDTNRWHIVRASDKPVAEFMKALKLGVPEDKLLHTTRLVLQDRSGEIRGYYDGISEDLLSVLRQDLEHLD